MPDPKRSISEPRAVGHRDAFHLEGFTDMPWEMVSIYWIDAESDGGSGWQDPEDMMDYARRPLPIMHSVGLLVYEDAEQIAITDTKGPEEMGSVTKIPRIWLKRFDRLGPISSKLEDASSGSPARRSLHPESRAG